MSQLKAKIQKTMTEAMKAKDASRLQIVRLIWNAIRKKEIDDRKDLTDADIEKTLLTMLKQTQESLAQAQGAARAEAIAESEGEIKVIKEFLPEAMSEEEVKKIINEIVAKLKESGKLPAGGAGMGAVMKESMAAIGSRAEGKVVQAAVKAALG